MNLSHSDSEPGEETNAPTNSATGPVHLEGARHTVRQHAWLVDLLPKLQGLPGVSAAWLTGSYARGIADAWSNVNLHVAFTGRLPEALRSSMLRLLEEVSPVIWCRATGDDPVVLRGIAAPTATEGERPGQIQFEIWCVSDASLAAHVRQHGPIHRLSGRLGNGQGAFETASAFEQPRSDEIQRRLEDFWVCLAELPACSNRGENLQAAHVLAQAREILVDLVVALNGARRPPGRRRLNDLLGPSQRAAFEKTLLVKSVDPTAWIGQAVAMVVLYRWYAPQLVDRLGVSMPQALENAVLAELARDIYDWPAQIVTE